MKNKVFLLIIFCLALTATAQLAEPMGVMSARIKQNRIKQKVLVTRMYVHEVNGKGEARKKGKLRSENVYDLRGNCIREGGYFQDMTIINERVFSENGRELKMVSKDGEGHVRQKLLYEYDNNDSLIRVNYYNADGRLVSSKSFEQTTNKNGSISHKPDGSVSSHSENAYDSLEHSFTSRLLTPTGELKYENKYYLDAKNQVATWTVIDNIQNKRSTRKYTYDDKGNKTEEHTYSESGEPLEKTTSTYNEKNLLVESIYFKPYTKVKEVFRYSYEYQ